MIVLNSSWGFVISSGWHTAKKQHGGHWLLTWLMLILLKQCFEPRIKVWLPAFARWTLPEQNAIIGCVCVCVCVGEGEERQRQGQRHDDMLAWMCECEYESILAVCLSMRNKHWWTLTTRALFGCRWLITSTSSLSQWSLECDTITITDFYRVQSVNTFLKILKRFHSNLRSILWIFLLLVVAESSITALDSDYNHNHKIFFKHFVLIDWLNCMSIIRHLTFHLFSVLTFTHFNISILLCS